MGWKQIDADEKDELQKEAEEMNELGIRKLPRDDDAPDPDRDTTDEDSDFEEGYRRKAKPIKLPRIKKEGEEMEGNDKSGEEDTSESDWEPEAEIVPKERDTSRSGRQRKRPSFFQEFESQENNLDNILQEFEQTQAAEFGKLKQPKPPPKPASERKPRKRKAPVVAVEQEEIPVEVETLRSGRKRKVRRVMNAFLDEEDEDDKLLRGASSDDDDFEPPPEEEVEKLEDEDDAIEEEEEIDEDISDEDLEDSDGERNSRNMMALPIKKRGRPKKILTDYEIEEATRAAMYTRPAIEITRVPRVFTAEGLAISKDVALDLILAAVEKVEGPDPAMFVAKKSAPAASADSEPPAENSENNKSPKFQWVNETLDDEEDTTKTVSNQENKNSVFNPLADSLEPNDDSNPLGDDGLVKDLNEKPVNEEDALLETVSAATEQPQFVNECQDDGGDNDNPLGDIDDVSEKVPESESQDPFSDSIVKSTDISEPPLEGQPQAQPPQPLSEDDLLTGPAHNLDDSQYKADYVDPNLEDIFK